MIFLLFELNSKNHSSASVWVDTNDTEAAKEIAKEKLAAEGYTDCSLLDAMSSTKDDYFPPCTSLDAFVRAEQEGYAINFS